MGKSEPVRRLEILTGAGRRRSWSAESLAGGSVSAVARRHGLTPQQLFAWRRQMRGSGVMGHGAVSFAPVVVAPSAIEIEYGGATIRVSAGSDATTLRAVFQAVKAVA
jgi:transposase